MKLDPRDSQMINAFGARSAAELERSLARPYPPRAGGVWRLSPRASDGHWRQFLPSAGVAVRPCPRWYVAR